MEKYKNKYRITSTRLATWDYGNSGMYFITICTKNRMHFFGEIVNCKMQLNDIGKIVNSEWLKTFTLRADMNLQMGEFVVMPNHFHAIIIIGDNKYNGGGRGGGRGAMHCASTSNASATNATINKFGPQSKNLASIVRGFKSSVTTYVRKNGFTDFGWQSRFHDHIIRNEKSFHTISNYIINNPTQWEKDKFNHNNSNISK